MTEKIIPLRSSFIASLLKVLLVAFVMYGCANESAPTGGKEDKEPPKLSSVSPADKTIRFAEKKIQFTFNEFLQPGGFAQTLISPPVAVKPVFRISRNKLTVIFKSELQANTTYTINFGDDIRDLNAGNITPNFTYVFSTGDFIDSQSVAGKVVTAATGAAAEGIIVSLYSDTSVGDIEQSKPMYFTKTDKNGQYAIQNVKAGKYKIFALKDENGNYRYDQPNELIGFANSLVDLTNDSKKIINLSVFQSPPKILKLISVKSVEAGKLQIIYSKPIQRLYLSGKAVEKGWFLPSFSSEDTITAWISDIYTQNTDLFLAANDTLKDTVSLKLKYLVMDTLGGKEEFKLPTDNQLFIANKAGGMQKNTPVKGLYGALKWNLSRPITEINHAKQPLIFEDSDSLPKKLDWWVDSVSHQTLYVDFARQPKTNYVLVVPDSMVYDVFGVWNTASKLPFTTDEEDNYGNIALKLSIADSSKIYVVQLLNSKGAAVASVRTQGMTRYQTTLQHLPAGTYRLGMFEDANDNGKWDDGNFLLRRQPEKSYQFKETYSLKGGWDLDVEVKF